MSFMRGVLGVVVLILIMVGCSARGEPMKLEVALKDGPLQLSVDSAGDMEFGTFLQQYYVDRYDLGEGVKAADELLAEEERRKWYIIFQSRRQEALFEFEPQGFLQVTQDGKVERQNHLRKNVVKLRPGAKVAITQISGTVRPPDPKRAVDLPDPEIPRAFLGTWKGMLREGNSPLRPITIRIPRAEIGDEKIEESEGNRPRTFLQAGTFRSPAAGQRPAIDGALVIVDRKRPITRDRLRAGILEGSKCCDMLLTSTGNGKVFLEGDMGDGEVVGLLTKES